MKKYLSKVEALIRGITDFKILSIPRDENQEVDTLSKYSLGVPPL